MPTDSLIELRQHLLTLEAAFAVDCRSPRWMLRSDELKDDRAAEVATARVRLRHAERQVAIAAEKAGRVRATDGGAVRGVEMNPREGDGVNMNRYEHSVVDVAMTIVGDAVGSSDALMANERGPLLAWLKWRINEGWLPSTFPRTAAFGQAVRDLARHALHVATTEWHNCMCLHGAEVCDVGPDDECPNHAPRAMAALGPTGEAP